jgi:thiol:disulfide interchange protein DsbD
MLFHDHPRARGLALGLAMIGAVLAAAGCRGAPAPEPPAEAASGSATTGPLVTVSAGVEPATTAPGGTLTVLWRFRPAPDWHLYWSGRNDSGFAPRVKLGLPPGWSAGPLQWPVPTRHVSAGDILDHVYNGELVLLQEFTAPTDAAPGSRVDLLADWQWLACRDSCVPGRDSLTVSVDVVSVDVVPAASVPAPSPALAAARARLPRPVPPDVVRTAWDGATLRIHREGPGAGTPAGRMTFMPAADCGDLADLLHDGVGESLALRLVPGNGQAGPVHGLLILEDAAGTARAFTIDVPAAPVAASPVKDTPAGG